MRNIDKLMESRTLQWSPRLRHAAIMVYGRSIRRTVQMKYHYFCCLGSAEMSDSDDRLERWSVRIGQMSLWMAVGMCQIRKVQQHKFEWWNWSNIGHGYYCINSDGGIFSHSDPNANFKILSFKFKTGDVLHFQYDQKHELLTVANHKGDQYQMKVERQGEKYAVCAYLIDIGDSIELINS